MVKYSQVIILSSYRELKAKIIKLGAVQRIPVLGEFELTARCNFLCPMCYVRDNAVKNELSTGQWLAIFNEAVNEGLVYALLTGGEPLLRADFSQLYEHLYDYGVRISVYTNGYQLTEEHLETFRKRPPELIAITLYGGSDATYTTVTGMHDGFTKVRGTIKKLKANNLNVACRVIPIPEVYKDLDAILGFVKESRLALGYFLYLAPSLNKDYQGRLSPPALADFEARIVAALPKTKRSDAADFDTSTTCAALRSGYAVNHKGYMQPCTLMNHPRKKLEFGKLLETFRELGDKWLNMAASQDCMSCSIRSSCIPCPARRHLEGDHAKCAPYLRAFAKERKTTDD